MRLNRLVASLVGLAGACVVGGPAKAAHLQSWQFDASQNRLTFKTDSSVQPRARLLSKPNRLIVELPGIAVDYNQVDQTLANPVVGGAVQQVRLERTDSQTTQMVLELNPNYQLTPQQIRVWGVTSQQWVVQLPDASGQSEQFGSLPPALRSTPTKAIPDIPVKGPQIELPQFIAQKAEDRGQKAEDANDSSLLSPPSSPPKAEGREQKVEDGPSSPPLTPYPLPSTFPDSSLLPPPSSLSQTKQVTTAYALPAGTQLQTVVTTPNGFFIQTTGAVPQVQVYRVRDRNQPRQLVVDILNAQLAGTLNAQTLPRDQYGVNTWSLTQFSTTPPAVRIVLALADNAPEWQVTPIRQGGIVLLPVGATTGTPSISPTIQTGIQVAQTPRSVTLPTLTAAPPQATPARPNQPSTTPLPQNQPTPNRPLPHGQAVVVLDPGHGGADPGAVGIGGLQEKLVVMAITQQVAAALRSHGITVLLTRQGDEEVDLQPRVDVAESANATLFVSIHANAISMDRPEVNGVETYFYSDLGEQFAQVLHSRVISMMNMTDRGTRQARFFVLRRTTMPAVLIETGYVTGTIDAPKLANPGWQMQMGSAIATGILDYLRQGY